MASMDRCQPTTTVAWGTAILEATMELARSRLWERDSDISGTWS
jgi:hypothetical protein